MSYVEKTITARLYLHSVWIRFAFVLVVILYEFWSCKAWMTSSLEILRVIHWRYVSRFKKSTDTNQLIISECKFKIVMRIKIWQSLQLIDLIMAQLMCSKVQKTPVWKNLWAIREGRHNDILPVSVVMILYKYFKSVMSWIDTYIILTAWLGRRYLLLSLWGLFIYSLHGHSGSVLMETRDL